MEETIKMLLEARREITTKICNFNFLFKETEREMAEFNKQIDKIDALLADLLPNKK